MFADVDSVEWDAPIVPGVSMVPIPLHASCGELDAIIAAHLIDADARRLNIPMKSPFPGGGSACRDVSSIWSRQVRCEVDFFNLTRWNSAMGSGWKWTVVNGRVKNLCLVIRIMILHRPQI